MLYRAPVAYKVARPIRSGGLALSVGEVLTDEQLAAVDLASMLGSRHLRPIISPAAVRSDIATAAGDPHDPAQRLTVAEILRIVGDDPEVAAAYLEAERESDRPRSTLVASLVATIKAGQDAPA